MDAGSEQTQDLRFSNQIYNGWIVMVLVSILVLDLSHIQYKNSCFFRKLFFFHQSITLLVTQVLKPNRNTNYKYTFWPKNPTNIVMEE